MFAAADPVFGGGACRVESCGRAARSKGMCQGHHLRWVGAGRPDLDVFAATTDLRWHRQRPNAQCRVDRVRLRDRARRDVSAARAAVGPRRATRPARVAGRPADDQDTAARRGLRGGALRSVAAGGVAALPRPRQHLEGQRAARHRRVRPPLRRGHGHRRGDHPAGPCSARSCVWRSSTCCSAVTTSGPPRPCPRWSWRWCGRWPPPARCRCWTGPRTTGGPGSAARRRATPPCAHC